MRFVRAPRGVLMLALAVGAAPSWAAGNPDRDAFFGETHVHTSWSLDAWLLGNRITGPADSYKYFKGQPIKHPAGYDVKIVTPLDWAGVTDHSEYVGVIKYANDPSSPVSKLAAAQIIRNVVRSTRSVPRFVAIRAGLAFARPTPRNC